MNKLISLLKAVMSEDMQLFKYNSKKKTGLSKLSFIFLIAGIFMYAIGNFAYMFMEQIPSELRYIVITLFIVLVTLLTLLEAIYKSQDILFSAKDNDLLFSMPIPKRRILEVRIIKMLTFQFLYNLIYILPVLAIYAFFEHPSINFYLISILLLIILPIIPTIIGCTLGYVVKSLSNKFKYKKLVQVLLSTILLLGVFYLSFNMNNLIAGLITNASSVEKIFTYIYYPSKLYTNLLINFNIIDLLILLIINIIPLILFIYIVSISYFKIITKERITIKNNKNRGIKIKYRSKLYSLINKEIKKFLSSPTFIINAGFGVFLILVSTIILCVNFDGMIGSVLSSMEVEFDINDIKNMIPKYFYAMIVFMSFMTSITSSMISLEGKSFNITKSLPVSSDKILLSKILTSNIISIPIILISDIIFFIVFKINLIYIVFILLASLICPTISALLGLIVNLKYPKMDAKNDTEVVKQSISSMVSVFAGMIFGFIAILLIFYPKLDSKLSIAIELVIFSIIMVILWFILRKYGNKRFKKINV